MYLVVCDWKNEYIHAEVSLTSEIASIKLQCELARLYLLYTSLVCGCCSVAALCLCLLNSSALS